MRKVGESSRDPSGTSRRKVISLQLRSCLARMGCRVRKQVDHNPCSQQLRSACWTRVGQTKWICAPGSVMSRARRLSPKAFAGCRASRSSTVGDQIDVAGCSHAHKVRRRQSHLTPYTVPFMPFVHLTVAGAGRYDYPMLGSVLDPAHPRDLVAP